MFNRIKVWRIWWLVSRSYTIQIKPICYLIRSMDQGVILHEYKIVIIEFEKVIIENFNIGVSRVALLECFPISIYYI